MTTETEESVQAKVPATIDKVASALTNGLLRVVDEGIGPLSGARAYAEDRVELADGDREKAIRRIVRESVATSGSAGFVTGVGGFFAMPVTLPAGIAGQAVINARMVAAIAHVRGWDLDDELVRNAVLITVAGGQANDVLKQLAVNVSGKVALSAIKRLPIDVIREINRRAGFMLVAKYGTKRASVTLVKAVPALGGIVGGAVDASFTKAVSTGAKRAFPERRGPSGSYAAILGDEAP